MNNWYWQTAQGGAIGPASLADLIAAVHRGEIRPTTFVSNDGATWKAASSVPALANAFGFVGPPSQGQPFYPPQNKGLGGCAIAAIVAGVLCFLGLTIAIGLLLPAIQEAEEANRTQCANNLKNIALALQTYYDANGALPPAYTVDENGRPLHSWRVLILPYLGEAESALYEEIRLDEPWNSEWNSQFHGHMPAVFLCPSEAVDATYGLTTYSVVVGAETAFPGGRGRRFSTVTDGLANTLGVVERYIPIDWMAPAQDLTFEDLAEEIGSEHVDGQYAAFLDGSVRFLPSTTDAATLKACATVDGGEELKEFEEVDALDEY